jgi:hypothetical protein
MQNSILRRFGVVLTTCIEDIKSLLAELTFDIQPKRMQIKFQHLDQIEF